MYKPNFRTINNFRRKHINELSGYFVDIVKMCKELNLIKLGQINIDGPKIKANAVNRRTKTKEDYAKWVEKIDSKIKNMLKAGEIDAKEDQVYGDKRGNELPEEINTEEKMKAKIKEIMDKITDEKKLILPTPRLNS